MENPWSFLYKNSKKGENKMSNYFLSVITQKNLIRKEVEVMTPLYDYNVAMIIGNYIVKSIANDKDLSINSRKPSLIKRLLNKLM